MEKVTNSHASKLLTTKNILIRLYVINGVSLQSMDGEINPDC
jgi:hypothetical protein